jgi:murein DD-endopeptidase MepM/ murein hydrolase activator NlpD
VGLLALVGLVPLRAGAAPPSGDPVANKFSFPVGVIPNSPSSSLYQAPNGRSYLGWAVHPAASFLSPAYGHDLQPGEDWGGRGGGATDLGQPVYAAAAGTILAAGYFGPSWGNIVLIRHTLPDGQVVLTQYAYLQDIVKTTGTVGWRELIGHVGTGRGGSVLHFEVRRDDMLDFPADYWPSSDGKDVDWVRTHYFSPTNFVRTHYLVLPPPAAVTPPTTGGTTPSSPGDPSAGGSSNSGPGIGTTPPGGTPGSVPPVTLPPPPPPTPVWDRVPHLDGSILKSAAGSYYLLDNGKKWLIATSEVLATWARPEEALSATDEELASYPDGSHPLGLRWGTLFKGATGPTCISDDPFDDPGLSCWVILNDDVFAAHRFSRSVVQTVSSQTLGLYIRPTPFDKDTLLPRGMLIKKPYGGYYVVENLNSSLPEVHPVTSPAALHSWQMNEAMAVEMGGTDFWDHVVSVGPMRFRSGTILQSGAGQLFVVSGEYKYLVPNMDVFHLRGYNQANAIAASDAELALHKDWPTPLR